MVQVIEVQGTRVGRGVDKEIESNLLWHINKGKDECSCGTVTLVYAIGSMRDRLNCTRLTDQMEDDRAAY